jgi:hypothetical protein
MEIKEFKLLSPFEKTVLLELARTQALANACFAAIYSWPNRTDLPNSATHLTKCLDDAMTGILETLRKNS